MLLFIHDLDIHHLYNLSRQIIKRELPRSYQYFLAACSLNNPDIGNTLELCHRAVCPTHPTAHSAMSTAALQQVNFGPSSKPGYEYGEKSLPAVIVLQVSSL